MKKMKKLVIVISLVICMLLTACGESQTRNTSQMTSLQSAGEEITQQLSDNEEDSRGDNTQSTKEDENASENNEVQPLERKEVSDNKDSEYSDSNENVGSFASQENDIENQGSSEESEQSKKIEKISGSIESVEDSSFMLAKTLTMKSENGGDIAVDTLIEADKEMIRVTYNDSTEFVVCTVVDRINGQYANGSASNLEVGKSVDLEGAYGDSVFVAQKVTVYVIR